MTDDDLRPEASGSAVSGVELEGGAAEERRVRLAKLAALQIGRAHV